MTKISVLALVLFAALVIGCQSDACVTIAESNQQIIGDLYEMTAHTTASSEWRQARWLSRFSDPNYRVQLNTTRLAMQKQLNVNNELLRSNCAKDPPALPPG